MALEELKMEEGRQHKLENTYSALEPFEPGQDSLLASKLAPFLFVFRPMDNYVGMYCESFE